VKAELHIVTGLSCSGKSTLCKELAASLGGTTIVLGDLIRDARTNSQDVSRATQRAFDGHDEYSADWIASLLAPALAVSHPPIVIDGAVPLDKVLPRLGLVPTSLLLLQASDQTRRDRLDSRRITQERSDDTAELFERRSRFHRQSQARMLSLAPRATTFEISGDHSLAAVLRQALAAITLARHHARRPFVDEICRRAGDSPQTQLVRLADLARRHQSVVRSKIEETLEDSPDPLLVFKPFRALNPTLVEAVLDKFASVRYAPTDAAVWPCTVVASSEAMPVHLELHYLLARWKVLPAECVGAGGPARPAYEVLGVGRTPQMLSSWWHSSPLPRKIARCLWLKYDAIDRGVVNGHIPALVDTWHRPDSYVAAVRLTKQADAVSWRSLRADVLGPADPAAAHINTLRGSAYHRLLPGAGPVSLSSNLVHLSAGPLEAVRERWLWFANNDQPGTNLIDRPTPTGSWLYESTANLDRV
jgi:adenylate kinase family enzyme